MNNLNSDKPNAGHILLLPLIAKHPEWIDPAALLGIIEQIARYAESEAIKKTPPYPQWGEILSGISKTAHSICERGFTGIHQLLMDAQTLSMEIPRATHVMLDNRPIEDDGKLLAELMMRASLISAASGDPYSARKDQLIKLSAQIWADKYWGDRQGVDRTTNERAIFLDAANIAIDVMIDKKMYLPEINENGGVVERMRLTEESYLRGQYLVNGRAAHSIEDWVSVPTGQEPYAMIKVSIASKAVATYAEGDVTVIHFNDLVGLKKEITETIEFVRDNGRIIDLTDLQERIGTLIPEAFDKRREAADELDEPAPKASIAPSA
jgi:hypothetical protein